jgi:WD40 repeat protein/serine/threonine protein kinase
MNQERPSKYLSITIETVDQQIELPDSLIRVLSKAMKKPTGEVLTILKTSGIRLSRVRLNKDLDLLVKSLKKSGLTVRAVPVNNGNADRQSRVPSDKTMRGGLTLPSSSLQIEPNWKKGEVIEGMYEVLGSAAGGMGRVYFVFHRLWKMNLAIKTPQRAAVKSETRVLRFLREAELWVDLGLHPNIATCYYARLLQGIPRLFIEYVDGGDLHLWKRQERLNDLWVVVDLMLQFTHGMMYAEDKGMIHRDIKPANCLISRDKILKITDFGLVKRVDDTTLEPAVEGKDHENTKLTDASVTLFEDGIMGSPWYMAPERLTGKGKDDIRSDIYSFGVMLYELAVGVKPFRFPKGFSLQALFKSHLRAKPVDPLSVRSNLPPKLVEIMLTCLDKKPENRYPSFAEVCRAMELAGNEVRPEKRPRPVPSLVGLKADSLNNQAVSVLDLGRDEEALHLLEDAHSANNEHLEAVYNLYTLRWSRCEISDREVANRMESLRIEVRETPDFHHLMGLVSLQRGDASRAVRSLEKSCQGADHYRDRWIDYEDGPRGFVNALGFTTIGEMGPLAGHMKTVRCLAFSPDSKRAFSVGEDRSIRIWDVDSGRCLKNTRTFAFDPVAGAFTPNGRFAATAYGDAFKTLDLWDLRTGNLVLRHQGMGCIAICFSQDSSLVAALGSDGRIWIRDVATEKVLWDFHDMGKGISRIALLDTNDALAMGGDDGSLQVRNLDDAEPRFLATGHTGRISFIGSSSDGSILLTGGEDETVRLWDSSSGKELLKFKGHRGPIVSASFTADNDHIVSASGEGSVKIWDPSNGRCYRTISVQGEHLTACCVSPSGTSLLVGGERGALRSWSLDTGWFSQNFLEPAICRPRTFQELSLIHYSYNNSIRDFNTLWERGETGKALKIFERITRMPGFSWSSESILIRNLLHKSSKRGRLLSGSFIRSFHGHNDAVVSVESGPDSLVLLTGSLDGTAALWDVVTGRKIKQFNVGTPVRKVLYLARVKGFLTWSDDNVLRLWDFDGNLIREIPEVKLPIALPVGGTEVAALSMDNRPLRIDLESLEKPKRGLPITSDEFVCFADRLDSIYSIKGRTRIQKWSSMTGRNEGSFRDLGLKITALKPSILNDKVVAGMETGEIMIYVGGSGVNVATLRGHTAAVRTLNASPDVRYWITGSDDCSVRLWDLKDERCVTTLEGHASPVRDVCFFPNMAMIASSGHDGTVRLWGLEWEITAVWKGRQSPVR